MKKGFRVAELCFILELIGKGRVNWSPDKMTSVERWYRVVFSQTISFNGSD